MTIISTYICKSNGKLSYINNIPMTARHVITFDNIQYYSVNKFFRSSYEYITRERYKHKRTVYIVGDKRGLHSTVLAHVISFQSSSMYYIYGCELLSKKSKGKVVFAIHYTLNWLYTLQDGAFFSVKSEHAMKVMRFIAKTRPIRISASYSMYF